MGYLAFALSILAGVAAGFVQASGARAEFPAVGGLPFSLLVVKALSMVAILLGFYGVYVLLFRALVERSVNRRRAHDARNVLRLAVGVVAGIATLGVLTEQWLGVLFSLGVVGFAVTFALQQPLLSFLGWIYIVAKRPYGVGDRVKIEDVKGDVIEVDFLVTTLWEINGELVSTNQPSGRVVTVPNSVVLSREVINFTTVNEYVWNELVVQVAYETDLAFASETMVEVATGFLGDEMARQVADFRERLAATPVDMDVQDHPTVNVVQTESWVELRLRYVAHPRRGTRVRNELYERILETFNDHPERVKFPLGRNR